MTDNEIPKVPETETETIAVTDAEARASVARIRAWQGFVVDVLSLLVVGVLAYLKVLPSEVITALLGVLLAGRALGTNKTAPTAGVMLGLFSAGVEACKRVS